MEPMAAAMESIRRNRGEGTPLGGSTGAELFETPQGKFVSKLGAHPAHVVNEYDMNRYLNALGVGVPDAFLSTKGRPEMITRYEEGATPLNLMRDRRQLREDYVPHATIANWDMLGLGMDNVLRRPDGSLSYVDLGGAGPFRAQGAPKGQAFTPIVGELETLQEKNPFAFGNISVKDMGRSFDMAGGTDAFTNALQFLRDKQTKNVMQQRIDDVARRVA